MYIFKGDNTKVNEGFIHSTKERQLKEEEEQNNPDTFIDSELDFEAAVAKREKAQLN